MKKTSDIIKLENKWSHHLLWSLVVSTLSGFSTYVIAEHNIWQQWMSLLHIFSSFVLVLTMLPYLFVHFKRTLITRRPFTLLLGIIAASLFVVLMATGLYITLFGQSEALHWIYTAHIYSAISLSVFTLLHIIIYWVYLPQSRKQTGDNVFVGFKKTTLTLSNRVTIALFAMVLISSTIYNITPSPYSTQPIVMPYELPYGDHPFIPAQTETDNQNFIDERIIAGSEKCAACHQQIAHEWKSSIHGKAAADKSYVKNINFLVQKKGLAAARYCESCHAPVALLSGQLSKGGKHGGIPGSRAFLEGVSCMSCHGIEKVKSLKGVGSYHFTPPKDYLFADKQNIIPTKIHNFLIQINPEQHKKDMARPILSSPKLCASCHIQFMDKSMNNWGWVPMQNQYDAWLKSPFSGQGEQAFSRAQTMRCQDCHFQAVLGEDPSANSLGEITSHRSLGSNTAIPWMDGDMQQFELVRKFLQSGKVRIDIEEPRRDDAIQSRQTVSTQNPNIENPFYLYLGESTSIRTIVSNQFVGHNFPAGATDIGEVWIHFRVADAQNKTVFESGQLSDTHDVDPSAHFYRSVPIDREGNHVWQHDLFNMVGMQYKNTIPAGESDVVEYNFTVPYWAKSPLTLTASIRHRNFNQKYARWALDDEDINLPITNISEKSINIPLVTKPEIGN